MVHMTDLAHGCPYWTCVGLAWAYYLSWPSETLYHGCQTGLAHSNPVRGLHGLAMILDEHNHVNGHGYPDLNWVTEPGEIGFELTLYPFKSINFHVFIKIINYT